MKNYLLYKYAQIAFTKSDKLNENFGIVVYVFSYGSSVLLFMDAPFF